MKKEKGQAVIDNLIVGMLAITLLAALLAFMWPITANFINLANTTPNYALTLAIVNAVPVFLALLVIVAIIRRFSGKPTPEY